MEDKQTIKKKKTILKVIEDYLFKDVKLLSGITSIIGVLFIILFVYYFLVGIKENLFNGYFETMVLGLLISIFVFVVPFYTKGWVGITNYILTIGGMLLWFSDSLIVYRIGTFSFSFFVTLHITYKLFNLLEK